MTWTIYVAPCEGCGETKLLNNYYAGAPFTCDPEWLCESCYDDATESAYEASMEDYYGGSTPTFCERLEMGLDRAPR